MAMSAAMLSLGERTASELARGQLSEVYVKDEHGYIVLLASGENAVLTALARKDAKLGLVFLDMKRTAGEVATIIWRWKRMSGEKRLNLSANMPKTIHSFSIGICEWGAAH